MKAEFDTFTQPLTDRRKFLVGLLFCSAAGFAAWRQPRINLDFLGKEKLDDLVPRKIGRWNYEAASGLVVPPEDQLVKILYSQLLTRVYTDGQGPPIMLLLAQSGAQTGFLQIHRPEFCYTAGGYQITDAGPHDIRFDGKIIPASKMDAELGGTVEHVVYWTRIGDRMSTSWKGQRWAVAEQNLRGIIPDAILVRISSVGADSESARANIDNFVRAFMSAIPANKRDIFMV